MYQQIVQGGWANIFRSRYIAKKSSGADPDPGFEMSSGPDPVMNYGRNRVTKFGRIRAEHYGSFYILYKLL